MSNIFQMGLKPPTSIIYTDFALEKVNNNPCDFAGTFFGSQVAESRDVAMGLFEVVFFDCPVIFAPKKAMERGGNHDELPLRKLT